MSSQFLTMPFHQLSALRRAVLARYRVATTALLPALSVLLLGACSLGPPPGVTPIESFSLERYLGTWYEIARLDHSFERGMSDVSARYSRNSDGSVRVLNRGFASDKNDWREAEGRALFIGKDTTGSLKVSFFGPFYGGYHIAELDPNYRWVLVVGPDTSYAWLLARDKTLAPAAREQLVAAAQRAGIDTSKLIWVTQTRNDPALTVAN